MSYFALPAADLLAVIVLLLVFVSRHGRRDLVVAYLGVNVGVLAVTTALTNSTVGAGLGLGLFGVLSIIRLRSEELAQHEVAYYFSALALGLLGGLGASTPLVPAALMVAVLAAVYVGDHPALAGPTASQEMLLDRAFADLRGLTAHIEGLLGAEVLAVDVRRVDLVNDTTLVGVRYGRSADNPALTAGVSA